MNNDHERKIRIQNPRTQCTFTPKPVSMGQLDHALILRVKLIPISRITHAGGDRADVYAAYVRYSTENKVIKTS